jgi:hypothetical protein
VSPYAYCSTGPAPIQPRPRNKKRYSVAKTLRPLARCIFEKASCARPVKSPQKEPANQPSAPTPPRLRWFMAHVRNTTYICTQQLPIPQHAAAKHGRLVTWLRMALWLHMALSSLPLSSQGAMQRRTRRGVICTVLRREASRGASLPHHFCPHPVTTLAARATFQHLSSLRLRSGARRRERRPVIGCLTTVGLPQSHRRQLQVSSLLCSISSISNQFLRGLEVEKKDGEHVEP